MLWWLQGLTEANKANNTKSVAGAEDHLRCCGSFIGCLKTTQVAFVATLVGVWCKECCDGYRSRLRPVSWLRWLLSVRVGRKECCGCFRGQLRTIMTLWWLHGLAEDHKGCFCGHLVRHRLQSVL